MTTTRELIEWCDGMLECEDGTSWEFFSNISAIRSRLEAAEKMAEALKVQLGASEHRKDFGEFYLEGEQTLSAWEDLK